MKKKLIAIACLISCTIPQIIADCATREKPGVAANPNEGGVRTRPKPDQRQRHRDEIRRREERMRRRIAPELLAACPCRRNKTQSQKRGCRR